MWFRISERVGAALLMLPGCSVLSGVELGYTSLPQEPLHGLSIAHHVGAWTAEGGAMSESVSLGVGYSVRSRWYLGVCTTKEIAPHFYLLGEVEKWRFFGRISPYVGTDDRGATERLLFSPTLQGGAIYIPGEQPFGVSWSTTVAYDVTAERPGLMVGLEMGVAFAHVFVP